MFSTLIHPFASVMFRFWKTYGRSIFFSVFWIPLAQSYEIRIDSIRQFKGIQIDNYTDYDINHPSFQEWLKEEHIFMFESATDWSDIPATIRENFFKSLKIPNGSETRSFKIFVRFFSEEDVESFVNNYFRSDYHNHRSEFKNTILSFFREGRNFYLENLFEHPIREQIHLRSPQARPNCINFVNRILKHSQKIDFEERLRFLSKNLPKKEITQQEEVSFLDILTIFYPHDAPYISYGRASHSAAFIDRDWVMEKGGYSLLYPFRFIPLDYLKREYRGFLFKYFRVNS